MARSAGFSVLIARRGLTLRLLFVKLVLPLQQGLALLGQLDRRDLQPLVEKIVDFRLTLQLAEQSLDVVPRRIPLLAQGLGDGGRLTSRQSRSLLAEQLAQRRQGQAQRFIGLVLFALEQLCRL